MRFENKVVFITGGGGYLGGEAAYEFAKEGASIALCDMNEEALNAKVERIKTLGAKVKGYLIDVTDSARVEEVVAKAVQDFGKIDISVHVAGGSARIVSPMAGSVLIYQKDHVIDRLTATFLGILIINCY